MSLPLKVEPSPQMFTSSACIARTSNVPVTARPSGVVLKYVRPPDRMWKAPHASAARPSSTSCGVMSTARGGAVQCAGQVVRAPGRGPQHGQVPTGVGGDEQLPQQPRHPRGAALHTANGAAVVGNDVGAADLDGAQLVEVAGHGGLGGLD